MGERGCDLVWRSGGKGTSMSEEKCLTYLLVEEGVAVRLYTKKIFHNVA